MSSTALHMVIYIYMYIYIRASTWGPVVKNLPYNVRLDPWPWKIPHTSEQLSSCTTATEARAPMRGVCTAMQSSPGYLVAQLVKNPPAMQETQVPPLGQEEPLEKKMATHSSILAWRIPRTEEPGEVPSVGSQRVRHD